MHSQEWCKSTQDNLEVSNRTCLFLPYHTGASWRKNALEVDQSFFHIKMVTEFESQAQKARCTKTDIPRECKYSIIYEWSASI